MTLIARTTLLAMAALTASLLQGCKIGATTEKDATDQFGAVIKNAGYTPQMPPTTMTRPGLVFAVMKDASGMKFRRVLCADLANGAPLIVNSEVPVTVTGSLTLNASAGVSLTESWLKMAGSADLQAAAKDVTSVTFTPANPQTEQMANIQAGTTIRPIPDNCLPQLQTAFDAQTGKPKYPVYLVIAALSYGKLQASYGGQGGPSFTGKLTAASQQLASLDLSATRDEKGNIDFTATPGQTMYFGVHLLQVPSLAWLHAVGAVRNGARLTLSGVPAAYPTSVGSAPFK